jgi:hypothetical protein
MSWEAGNPERSQSARALEMDLEPTHNVEDFQEQGETMGDRDHCAEEEDQQQRQQEAVPLTFTAQRALQSLEVGTQDIHAKASNQSAQVFRAKGATRF